MGCVVFPTKSPNVFVWVLKRSITKRLRYTWWNTSHILWLSPYFSHSFRGIEKWNNSRCLHVWSSDCVPEKSTVNHPGAEQKTYPFWLEHQEGLKKTKNKLSYYVRKISDLYFVPLKMWVFFTILGSCSLFCFICTLILFYSLSLLIWSGAFFINALCHGEVVNITTALLKFNFLDCLVHLMNFQTKWTWLRANSSIKKTSDEDATRHVQDKQWILGVVLTSKSHV